MPETDAAVLIIDSEPLVRIVLKAILERNGYRVSATGEFREALRLMRESPPRLVLTNVFLQGITGHDAMKQIRTEFPTLPVLMVSGLPDDNTVQEWMQQSGFDAFPKPFVPAALLRKVGEMLASK